MEVTPNAKVPKHISVWCVKRSARGLAGLKHRMLMETKRYERRARQWLLYSFPARGN